MNSYEDALKDIRENGIALGAGDFVSVDALKVACVAIERQIPKKPEGIAWLYCPVCGRDALMDQFKFCPDCGQAIDWEGIE